MIALIPRRVYFLALFFVLTLQLIPLQLIAREAWAGVPSRGRSVRVVRVIDGDTIVIGNGERLRYIGIDTPERGEKFFEEARDLNIKLLRAGSVEIVECRAEKQDKYGRTLAWVYAGGRLVNGELLSAGLAHKLVIPPCGLEKRALLERLVWQARSSGRGLWRDEGGIPLIPPEAAVQHIGQLVRIEGVVRKVRERPRVVFVEFGNVGKAAFKAVIFTDALKAFKSAGMAPSRFSGRKLTITGVVRRYKGKAEIILAAPEQVSFEAP